MWYCFERFVSVVVSNIIFLILSGFVGLVCTLFLMKRDVGMRLGDFVGEKCPLLYEFAYKNNGCVADPVWRRFLRYMRDIDEGRILLSQVMGSDEILEKVCRMVER